MFNSGTLLSSKGPLGAIWVAAYCLKRLKKSQVKETDIPTSVGSSTLPKTFNLPSPPFTLFYDYDNFCKK
ncbi:hypothetical protein L6164_004986 [Bauhinia variegata]|uniref:Uncharacterized protein n=1 Tax=Bauhinia variegata TaxID=167791 RepID=A0ACB9PPY1_BAUVA|nr:hypothetical protein L6164_004986 [Bauhinia variegata]